MVRPSQNEGAHSALLSRRLAEVFSAKIAEKSACTCGGYTCSASTYEPQSSCHRFENQSPIAGARRTAHGAQLADRFVTCDLDEERVGGGKTLKRVPPSSAAFALILVSMGTWGLVQGKFVGIWAPGIAPTALRTPMIWACSLFSLGGGAGLLLPRFAPLAMRMFLAFLCVWLVWCKGIALIHAPGEFASWESLGETAVIASATWILAAFPKSGEKDGPFHDVGDIGPRIIYGLALIAFGMSHLGYVTLTASLVPTWLPSPVSWVYLTAATYVAAGTALVVGRFSRLAAGFSALQMALFGLMVWLPRIAAGARDADTLNETAISFALAASGWVVWEAIKSSMIDVVPSGRTLMQPRPLSRKAGWHR